VKKKARRKREKVERHRVVETPRERQVRLAMERRDRQVQSFLHRERLQTMRAKGFKVPEAGESWPTLVHELGNGFHEAAAASAALGESFGATATSYRTAAEQMRRMIDAAQLVPARRPVLGHSSHVNGPMPNLIIDEAAEIPDGELWMFSEPKSSRVLVDGKEIEATITDWKLEAPAPGFEQSGAPEPDYQREFYSRYLDVGAARSLGVIKGIT
jgi:Tfp pilus assembly protein FimV